MVMGSARPEPTTVASCAAVSFEVRSDTGEYSPEGYIVVICPGSTGAFPGSDWPRTVVTYVMLLGMSETDAPGNRIVGVAPSSGSRSVSVSVKSEAEAVARLGAADKGPAAVAMRVPLSAKAAQRVRCPDGCMMVSDCKGSKGVCRARLSTGRPDAASPDRVTRRHRAHRSAVSSLGCRFPLRAARETS